MRSKMMERLSLEAMAIESPRVRCLRSVQVGALEALRKGCSAVVLTA